METLFTPFHFLAILKTMNLDISRVTCFRLKTTKTTENLKNGIGEKLLVNLNGFSCQWVQQDVCSARPRVGVGAVLIGTLWSRVFFVHFDPQRCKRARP